MIKCVINKSYWKILKNEQKKPQKKKEVSEKVATYVYNTQMK